MRCQASRTPNRARSAATRTPPTARKRQTPTTTWSAGPISARALIRSPGVDRAMQAELRFDSGLSGQVTCSMWSRRLLQVGFHVTGDAGELKVFNPMGPNLYHRISLRGRQGRSVEHLSRRPTYEFQLEAFCAAVTGGDPPITDAADAIANMAVIDAVYRHAGLDPRSPTP